MKLKLIIYTKMQKKILSSSTNDPVYSFGWRHIAIIIPLPRVQLKRSYFRDTGLPLKLLSFIVCKYSNYLLNCSFYMKYKYIRYSAPSLSDTDKFQAPECHLYTHQGTGGNRTLLAQADCYWMVICW